METREKQKIKCEYCDKLLSPGAGVASHVRVEHPEEWSKTHTVATLTCEICQKKFEGKAALNRHKKEEHGITRSRIVATAPVVVVKKEEDDALNLHYCPKCGMKDPRTKFCPECGLHLERIALAIQNLVSKGFLSWY